MTVTLATALVLQIAAIIMMRYRLGRLWLRRPVVLLMLTSMVYLGLSQVLLTFESVSVWDNFRYGVPRHFTDLAALIMSGAMFMLSGGYLMTRPERAVPEAHGHSLHAADRALDWRLLSALCIPLAVLTYAGRGFNDGTAAGAGTALSTDLASAFFMLLVVLAAFGFLLRHGMRWFIPVLMVQSLLLAAAGERGPVIMDGVTLILLAAWAGRRPRGRQLIAAVALTVIASLAVTGSRISQDQGRGLYYTSSGLSGRVSALRDGFSAVTGTVHRNNGPGLIAQVAVRLDGTAFTGGILQGISFGDPRLTAGYVPGSLLLEVPRALWPSKLQFAGDLAPQQVEINDFGLQQINYLPTLPGMYIGFMAIPWLLIMFFFLGSLFGLGERRLLRRCTPARLVLLAGAINAALWFEAALPSMLLTMRAALVAVVAVKAVELARSRKARRARKDDAQDQMTLTISLSGPAHLERRRNRTA